MAGGDVKITDVCVDEHSRMMELDAEVYEGMPYKNVPSMSDLMKNSVDPNVVWKKINQEIARDNSSRY